jgi:hypothetical protein
MPAKITTISQDPEPWPKSEPQFLKGDKKIDVGQIRTDAPEGTRFLVLRDNHSATTPCRDFYEGK